MTKAWKDVIVRDLRMTLHNDEYPYNMLCETAARLVRADDETAVVRMSEFLADWYDTKVYDALESITDPEDAIAVVLLREIATNFGTEVWDTIAREFVTDARETVEV